MVKVRKRNLLLIAGLVWFMAGFNVARIGVLVYRSIDHVWYLYCLSLVVFMVFGRMFLKMTKNHTKRIMAYDTYVPFWKFFDKKSYLIMAFMMSFGIGLRASGLAPDFFIGFFYTGLGFALALAGIVFIKNYFVSGK